MTKLIERAMRELFGKYEALLSRNEAIKFWRNQMEQEPGAFKYRNTDERFGTSCTSYGNCELMQLMDAIYGIADHKEGMTEHKARQTEREARLQEDIARWI